MAEDKSAVLFCVQVSEVWMQRRDALYPVFSWSERLSPPRSPCDFPVYDYLYSFSSVYPQSPESNTNGSKYQHLSLWSTPYLCLKPEMNPHHYMSRPELSLGGRSYICSWARDHPDIHTYTHRKKVTGTEYGSKVSHLAFNL